MPDLTVDGGGYWVWLSALVLSLVGICGGLLGLALPRRLGGPRARLCGVALLSALVILLLAEALAWARGPFQGVPLFLARLGLIGGGVVGLGVLVPRTATASWTPGPTYSRRLALGLLLAGPVLFGWLLLQVELPPAERIELPSLPDVVPAAAPRLYTDAGTFIQGFRVAGPGPVTDADLGELKGGSRRAGVLIQVAGPDANANCHGWVFAGGRALLKGHAVEQVLRDNSYRPVEDPGPGDLIVYRDDGGGIMHTGVVKAVGTDGFVLVESKWGTGGRYLHEPEAATGYGRHYGYYRSARPGHVLRGGDPATGETPGLPQAGPKVSSRS